MKKILKIEKIISLKYEEKYKHNVPEQIYKIQNTGVNIFYI